MRKLLLILAVISFALPILYFNWVLYTVDGFGNYFVDMYWLLNHWTSGEMGWFQIYPIIFGVVCLVIRRIWFPKLFLCGGVFYEEEFDEEFNSTS